MNRYLSSFALTALIYIGAIVSYFVYFKDNTSKQSAKKSSQRVNFTIISKKPPQKVIKKVVKTEQKKPKKKIIKKKIKKKMIKKKPTPKPKLKKITKPKKVIKKTIKKIVPKNVIKKQAKKIVEKIKPIKKEQPFIHKSQIKKVKSNSKVGVSKKDNKQKELKKQKYFTLIKQTINQNKKYPKKAVRRGIQGIIKVQFTVSKDGKLLNIDILDGKKIFYKSIKKAIKNSFPLTPPKNIFIKSFKLTLKIIYKLR